MSKPTTRQDSRANISRTTKSPPKRTVVNPNLVNLSGRGKVKVTTRGSTGRGRGSTPCKTASLESSSVGTRSSTSIRAIRASPASHTLEPSQFSRTEEFVDSFGRELPSESLENLDTESLRSSFSSVLDTRPSISDAPAIMATGGENQGSSNQATNTSNMEDLLAYFQEAMRNNRDEFRRELSALRESMGSAANNGANAAMPGLNAQASGSRANSSAYATFNLRFKLKDWKISYSGEGSVSDFLFKLDTLVERSQCPHEHLMSNFHIFLTGKAETFYWDYIRQFQRATYPMLRAALSKEFGSRESDHEILLKISTRKQLPKESYDDYHSFIVRWNLRLTNPMTDEALIEIIKKNVHAELKVMLFIASPTDLGNLRDMARKAEKILLESKSANPNRQRQVNEIASDTTTQEISDDELELDPQVEALKANRAWTSGDYSRIKCWNCLQLGHSYIYCPEESRHVFCYKCGQRGVTTVKCTGPHMGNRRRSEWATGDARSSK